MLELNGKDPRAKLLREIIHDQATATTRFWYYKRAEPFDKRQDDNVEQGIYFKEGRKAELLQICEK